MTNSTANAYLTTKVMSASPAELRLMLLDGAIKFARQGLEGLTTKQYEISYTGICQCRNIVLELLQGIRQGDDPELAEKVRSVYSFLYAELVEIGISREPTRMERVIGLLEYERETWAMLMSKLADERGAKAQPDGERAKLSIQA